MLSGGKDAATVLTLAREMFEPGQLTAVFLYLVPGIRCVESAVEAQCRLAGGVELVHLPHFMLAEAFRHSVYQPQRHEAAASAPRLKYRDLEDHARAVTGRQWVLGGHRKMDSLERRGMITKSGPLDEKNQRCYPIADWNDAEVWAFCRAKRLPLAPRLGTRVRSTGLNLEPDVLLDLSERYPEDYQRVLEVFPYAEAAVFREQERRRSDIQGG